jgi:hypothetical protein
MKQHLFAPDICIRSNRDLKWNGITSAGAPEWATMHHSARSVAFAQLRPIDIRNYGNSVTASMGADTSDIEKRFFIKTVNKNDLQYLGIWDEFKQKDHEMIGAIFIEWCFLSDFLREVQVLDNLHLFPQSCDPDENDGTYAHATITDDANQIRYEMDLKRDDTPSGSARMIHIGMWKTRNEQPFISGFISIPWIYLHGLIEKIIQFRQMSNSRFY